MAVIKAICLWELTVPSSGLWLVLDALGLELIAAAGCCHSSLSSSEWPSLGVEVGFLNAVVDFSGEATHLVGFCLEILPALLEER
jgi:hypothetical protein